MARKTYSALKTSLKSVDALFVKLTIVDNVKIRYSAAFSGTANGPFDDVADDMGKIKVFPDADTAVKFFAQNGTHATIDVSVTNAVAMSKPLKITDPVAAKTAETSQLQSAKDNLTAAKVAADAAVAASSAAGYPTGNTLEIAYHAEQVARASAVAAGLTVITDRATAIGAVLV